jgi:predicted negative regulator of RcsB-dependent stress response
VPPLDLYARRLEARAAAASGEPERAAASLGSVADGFGELEAGWEAAVTKLDLAHVFAQLGKVDEALGSIQDAAPVFDRLGSARERSRADGLLGRLT